MIHPIAIFLGRTGWKKSCTRLKNCMIKHARTYVLTRNRMAQLIESGPSDLLLNNRFYGWQKQTSIEVLPTLPLRRKSGRRAIRSQDEIEAAILDSCRTPTVQHWIMVKARLGYDTFWKHMNLLLTAGLMTETCDGSKTLYQTNAKGLELLGRLAFD